jgi:hypothetical protein
MISSCEDCARDRKGPAIPSISYLFEIVAVCLSFFRGRLSSASLLSQQSSGLVQSKFVNQVLLRRGQIELINQEIFSSALSIEFGDQKGVEFARHWIREELSFPSPLLVDDEVQVVELAFRGAFPSSCAIFV